MSMLDRDGDRDIVRSIDITSKKEYNYEYEEGRIVRATEADIELSGEIVSARVIVNTIKYYYDTEGKMTKKVITPASGPAQTIYYETNDDKTIVKFSTLTRSTVPRSSARRGVEIHSFRCMTMKILSVAFFTTLFPTTSSRIFRAT